MTIHEHGVLYRIVEVHGAPTRERYQISGTVDFVEEHKPIRGLRALVVRPNARWDRVVVNDRTTGYSSVKLARLDLAKVITEHDREDLAVNLVDALRPTDGRP